MNQVILIIMTLISQTSLILKSPAFTNNGLIPSKYTCDGNNINPPLQIEKIPGNTKTLALILDDPDAPHGTFDHWIMWNIPPKERIEENSAPGIQGKNGMDENTYKGPCPPNGSHHYHFKIFALDTTLQLPDNADKKVLLKAMEGHVLAKGELIGTYARK